MNTNNTYKSNEESLSLNFQDSNLKVNKNGNSISSALINHKKTSRKKDYNRVAVGYTSHIEFGKTEWVKSITRQTGLIYSYCLKNNIKLAAMFFESSELEMEFENYSINQMAYLIRKHKVSEVICIDFENLNLDIICFSLFRKLLRKEGVTLTVLNRFSHKNKEFIEFMDEEERFLNRYLAREQKNKILKKTNK